MVQWLGKIGEENENKWEIAAQSTDTLPTERNGTPLTHGSTAAVYDASGDPDTTEPVYKQLIEIGTNGPEWRPM